VHVLTEGVEEAALAGVGCPGDDHLHAAAEPLAPPLVLQVALHLRLQGQHPPVHCGEGRETERDRERERERKRGGGDSEGRLKGVPFPLKVEDHHHHTALVPEDNVSLGEK